MFIQCRMFKLSSLGNILWDKGLFGRTVKNNTYETVREMLKCDIFAHSILESSRAKPDIHKWSKTQETNKFYLVHIKHQFSVGIS